MRRLEAAGILVAVRVEAGRSLVRIVQTDAGAHQAALDGFVLYSPKDMYAKIVFAERS
jgi:hypothetical protein